jgi:hypothetical protein
MTVIKILQQWRSPDRTVLPQQWLRPRLTWAHTLRVTIGFLIVT